MLIEVIEKLLADKTTVSMSVIYSAFDYRTKYFIVKN
jgi:hypothetical protein